MSVFYLFVRMIADLIKKKKNKVLQCANIRNFVIKLYVKIPTQLFGNEKTFNHTDIYFTHYFYCAGMDLASTNSGRYILKGYFNGNP